MATSANQIQADIAQTRSRITNNLDTIEANPQASLQSLTSGVTSLIRRRPLTTLGFSLFAGALLQDLLGGGASAASSIPSVGYSTSYGTPTQPSYGTSAVDAASSAVGTAAGTAKNAVSTAANTATGAASTAVDTAANAASTAADVATNAVSSAADAAGSAVSTAADAAGNAVSTVADTATNVATTVADTASSVASTAVDTATGAASRVADIASEVSTTVADTTVSAANRIGAGVSNLGTTISEQVHQRPLAAFGVAVGVGALLQPVLTPYVGQVTSRVQSTVDSVGSSVSEISSDVAPSLALPNQGEADRIRQALVPATVDRAKQLANRELREYLDQRLEGVVGQTSLRAGIVAAVTDKTGDLVEQRLPSVLNRSLSGTRAVIVAAILGAVLDAYTKAQQGEGKTTEIVKRDLAHTLTETSTQQLKRYFPEFRDQYQRIEA